MEHYFMLKAFHATLRSEKIGRNFYLCNCISAKMDLTHYNKIYQARFKFACEIVSHIIDRWDDYDEFNDSIKAVFMTEANNKETLRLQGDIIEAVGFSSGYFISYRTHKHRLNSTYDIYLTAQKMTPEEKIEYLADD